MEPTNPKSTGYADITAKLQEVMSLLQEKIDEKPDSEECKNAMRFIRQAMEELAEEKEEDMKDVDDMEKSKESDDYMSEFMNE